MRKYVDYSHYNNESSIDITLEINDDGRFSYDEWWHTYGSSSGGQASGTWHEDNEAFYFHCDYADGQFIFQWSAGGESKAVKKEDSIEFGGYFEMSLVSEKSAPATDKQETPETVKSSGESEPVKPNLRIAKLHFKDGRVLTRQILNDSMLELYTQTYYRLVDDLGNATYTFQRRQNYENQDSSDLEYDEIFVSMNDESDE